MFACVCMSCMCSCVWVVNVCKYDCICMFYLFVYMCDFICVSRVWCVWCVCIFVHVWAGFGLLICVWV